MKAQFRLAHTKCGSVAERARTLQLRTEANIGVLERRHRGTNESGTVRCERRAENSKLGESMLGLVRLREGSNVEGRTRARPSALSQLICRVRTTEVVTVFLPVSAKDQPDILAVTQH